MAGRPVHRPNGYPALLDIPANRIHGLAGCTGQPDTPLHRIGRSTDAQVCRSTGKPAGPCTIRRSSKPPFGLSASRPTQPSTARLADRQNGRIAGHEACSPPRLTNRQPHGPAARSSGNPRSRGAVDQRFAVETGVLACANCNGRSIAWAIRALGQPAIAPPRRHRPTAAPYPNLPGVLTLTSRCGSGHILGHDPDRKTRTDHRAF